MYIDMTIIQSRNIKINFLLLLKERKNKSITKFNKPLTSIIDQNTKKAPI